MRETRDGANKRRFFFAKKVTKKVIKKNASIYIRREIGEGEALESITDGWI
jgi:hypothetical protein